MQKNAKTPVRVEHFCLPLMNLQTGEALEPSLLSAVKMLYEMLFEVISQKCSPLDRKEYDYKDFLLGGYDIQRTIASLRPVLGIPGQSTSFAPLSLILVRLP